MTAAVSTGTRRVLLAGLALGILAAPDPARPAGVAEGRGTIRGVLFRTDGVTRLAAAKVTAVDVKTGRRYVGPQTTEDGGYAIGGLPRGSYDIVIESAGSVFVADDLVDLPANATLSRNYAVLPLRPANRMVAGMGRPTGSAVQVEELKAAPAPGRGFWRSPKGLALLGGLGAAVGYALVQDDDGSPSSP
jgi:hypothetical protein